MRTTETDVAKLGCCLGTLFLNLVLGSWSVNFLLNFFVDNTIPWIGAALIGLIAGQFTIPIAIVVKLLQIFGVL